MHTGALALSSPVETLPNAMGGPAGGLRAAPPAPYAADFTTGSGGGAPGLSARPSLAPGCCCCDAGDCCDCCQTNTFLAPCLRAWVDLWTGSGAAAARYEQRHGVLLPLDAAGPGAVTAAARERAALFRARQAQRAVERYARPYKPLLAAAARAGRPLPPAVAAAAAGGVPPVSVAVAVRAADALSPRRGLRFPCVRVHIVDLRTGAYLAPSAQFPSDAAVTYAGPAATGAFTVSTDQQQQRWHVLPSGALVPYVPSKWTDAVDLRAIPVQDYSRGRGRAGKLAAANAAAAAGGAGGDIFAALSRRNRRSTTDGADTDGSSTASSSSDDDDDSGSDGDAGGYGGNSRTLIERRRARAPAGGGGGGGSASSSAASREVLVQRGSYAPRWTGPGASVQFDDLQLSDILTPYALVLYELLDLGGPQAVAAAAGAHPDSEPALSRPDCRIAWAFTVVQKAPVRGPSSAGAGAGADPGAAWPGESMFNLGPSRLQLYNYTHAPLAHGANRPGTPLVYFEWVWQKNTKRDLYPSTLYTVLGGLPPSALLRYLTLDAALLLPFSAAGAGGPQAWGLTPEAARQLAPQDVAVLTALAPSLAAKGPTVAQQLEARRLALLERLLAVYGRAPGGGPRLVRPPRLDARLSELLCGPQGCSALAFSPSGMLLAGACGETFNFCIKLWEYAPMQELAPGAAGQAAARALSPAALGPLTRSWRLLHTLRGHQALIHDLAWHPDGSELLSASADGTAMVWAVDSAALHEPSLLAVEELRRSGGGLTSGAGAASVSAAAAQKPLVVPAPSPAALARQMAARARLCARATPVLVLQHLTFVYTAKFFAPKTAPRDAFGAPLPPELAPPPLILTGAYDGKVRVWSRAGGALLSVLSDAPLPAEAAATVGGSYPSSSEPPSSARGGGSGRSLLAASEAAEADLRRRGLRPGSGRVTNTGSSYALALSAATRAVLSPEVSQGAYLSTVADSVDQVAALLGPSAAAAAAPTAPSAGASAAWLARGAGTFAAGAARVNALIVPPEGGRFYTADALGRVRVWEDLHAFAPVLLHTRAHAAAGVTPEAMAAASVVGSALALAQAQELDVPSPDLAEVAGIFGGEWASVNSAAGGARVNGLTALEWRSRFRVFRTLCAAPGAAGAATAAAVSSLALVPRPLPEALLALSQSNSVLSLPLVNAGEPARVLTNAAGFTARTQHLSLALSPCGSTLVAGSEDGRAYVFDVAPEAVDALAAGRPGAPAAATAAASPGRLSYVIEAGFPLPLRAVSWSAALNVVALGAFGGNYPVVIMGPSQATGAGAQQQQQQQEEAAIAAAATQSPTGGRQLPPLRGDYGSGLTRTAPAASSTAAAAASPVGALLWESAGQAAAREAALARVAARMRNRYGIDLNNSSPGGGPSAGMSLSGLPSPAPGLGYTASAAPLSLYGSSAGSFAPAVGPAPAGAAVGPEEILPSSDVSARRPQSAAASRGIGALSPLPAPAPRTDGPGGTVITPPRPEPGTAAAVAADVRTKGGEDDGSDDGAFAASYAGPGTGAAGRPTSASATEPTVLRPSLSTPPSTTAPSRSRLGGATGSLSRTSTLRGGAGAGVGGANAGTDTPGQRPGSAVTVTNSTPSGTGPAAAAGEPATPVGDRQRRLEQELEEHSGGSAPGTPEGADAGPASLF
jgi:WD40 repeat protein